MSRFFMGKGIAMFLVVLLVCCKTQPQLSEIIDDMVVETNFDSTLDYSGFDTYVLPLDTVGLVSNTSTSSAFSNDYAKLITSSIKNNLDKTGRTRVAKGQDPDLGINAFVVDDISIFQSVVYPNYYAGYPGYNYGGYYGYYGYYSYPYVNTYQFQSAILVIEIVDLKTIDPTTHQAKVVWVANIGDLVNSYEPSAKVQEAIGQAFVQSDYLNR